MKALVGIVGVFGFVVWDMSTQHGAWTRPAMAALIQTLRNLGLV